MAMWVSTRGELSTQDSSENDIAVVEIRSQKGSPSPIVQQLNSSKSCCLQSPGMPKDVSKESRCKQHSSVLPCLSPMNGWLPPWLLFLPAGPSHNKCCICSPQPAAQVALDAAQAAQRMPEEVMTGGPWHGDGDWMRFLQWINSSIYLII